MSKPNKTNPRPNQKVWLEFGFRRFKNQNQVLTFGLNLGYFSFYSDRNRKHPYLWFLLVSGMSIKIYTEIVKLHLSY